MLSEVQNRTPKIGLGIMRETREKGALIDCLRFTSGQIIGKSCDER